MRWSVPLGFGAVALLTAGCHSTPQNSYVAAYEALTLGSLSSGFGAPSTALLAELDDRRGGTFEPSRLTGREWLRFAWHAAAVGRQEDAQAAIGAASAADRRLGRVAGALARALADPPSEADKR